MTEHDKRPIPVWIDLFILRYVTESSVQCHVIQHKRSIALLTLVATTRVVKKAYSIENRPYCKHEKLSYEFIPEHTF